MAPEITRMARRDAVFGTCAGMKMMAREISRRTMC
jgi:glutamine amidotransferase PdxT